MTSTVPDISGRENREIPTSLEVPLIREDGRCRIDLSSLQVFFGLSILAADLAEKVRSRYLLDRIDIEVEKKVKPAETPELAELRIENIKVVADYDVLDPIIRDREAFVEDLTTVFGSLQMRRWRRHIYPEDPGAPTAALVFELVRKAKDGDIPFRVVLERIRSSKRADKFFLRAVIEGRGRRLDLGSFPHVIVENPDGRSFIAGSTRISRMFAEQVRWKAREGKHTYVEADRIDSSVFARLHESGLDELREIEITWSGDCTERFRVLDPGRLMVIFKKVLLLLEDHPTRGLLTAGESVRVDFGGLHAWLDFSQLGRALNISFGRVRRSARIERYLERMPGLKELVDARCAHAPLAGTKVFLIHHVTAEVLALVAALRDLGARDVFVLFVHYGEEIPSEFLEALLDLDQEHFRFFCLNNVAETDSVEGYFVLSPRFSKLDGLEELDAVLYREKPGYTEAMERTAARLFLEILMEADREDSSCLVIEDGGYLSPRIPAWVREGAGLGDLVASHGPGLPAVGGETAGLSVGEILDRRMIGTVEHTKNGFDRLAELMEEDGRLARPAFSIAVSRIKVDDEAREVAAAILAATESTLHAMGKVMSRRKPVVIGSEGAIGRHLTDQLRSRSGTAETVPPLEVDIRKPRSLPGDRLKTFAVKFGALPRDIALEVDLIVGVTGHPAFTWEDMELLLLEGRARTYYLVSGSTKTVEFSDVARGLGILMRTPGPAVGGRSCTVENSAVTDPQTGKILGSRHRFTFEDTADDPAGPRWKEIVFPGSLMPINFLSYGVPGEAFDPVITQLLRTSLGLVRRIREEPSLAPVLSAVDREIDEDGQPLARVRPEKP